MGVVLLVRHGQASLGTADYDVLSDLGREQARLAGRRVAGTNLRVDRVVTGRLKRQLDTASELLGAAGTDVPQTIDARLDEWDHDAVLAAHGTVNLATPPANDELQIQVEIALSKWLAVPGDEPGSHGHFLDGGRAIVEELGALPGTTMAVTSGGIIAGVCAGLLELPDAQWPKLSRIITNASFTKIITSGRHGQLLVTFNDHAHLEADRRLITYR